MTLTAFVRFIYDPGEPVSVRVREGFRARWAEISPLPVSEGRRITDEIHGREDCLGFAGYFSTAETQMEAAKAGCPLINYSNRHGLFPSGRNIIVNEEEIGRLAAEHLLLKGYRHFGFVEEESSAFARDRREGFARALTGKGDSLSQLTLSAPRMFNPVEYARELQTRVNDWISQLEKPVGILGANDSAAVQFLGHAKQVSPESLPLITVIGVDNVLTGSSHPLPNDFLSSIEPNFRGVGVAIAEELAEYIDGRPLESGSVRRIDGASLIERASTAGLSSRDPLVMILGREIHREILRGEAPRVDELAQRMEVSPRTLLNRFSAATGLSLRDYILRERLLRAASLLCGGQKTVAETAFACGFSKQGSLSSHFKRLYGCTPREFKQRCQSETGPSCLR